MFKFEKLEVWHEAVVFTGEIHELSRLFPKEEIYILTSQIKRVADSIALNIGEGSTGQTNAEFRQFLGYAIRSGIEVATCLFVAKQRNLIEEKDFLVYCEKTEKLVIRIQALRKSLK